jgi:cathepsin L
MATVTTLSAHSEIAYGKNTHFSAQELVDCVQNPLNCGGKGGCDGATVELAMDWAVYQGVERLDSAPSTYAQGKCKKPLFRSTKEEQGKLDSDGRLMQMAPVRKRTLVESKDELSIGLTGYTSLPTNQYKPLLAALLTGPVAISVDASRWSLYSGGIFDDCKGSYATINHAVVLFGYGKTSRDGYWLIRNSWSDYWGEDGYMRMLRTDDEESTCYTDMDPKMGVSCDGAPSSVKVCGTCGILYDNVVPHFSGGPKKSTYSTDANGRVAPVEDSPMFGNIWR